MYLIELYIDIVLHKKNKYNNINIIIKYIKKKNFFFF